MYVRVASRNRRLAHMTDFYVTVYLRRLPQFFCIHSASFKLNLASFTEKSSVEMPLLFILFMRVV